jgi:hypothetical protein
MSCAYASVFSTLNQTDLFLWNLYTYYVNVGHFSLVYFSFSVVSSNILADAQTFKVGATPAVHNRFILISSMVVDHWKILHFC